MSDDPNEKRPSSHADEIEQRDLLERRHALEQQRVDRTIRLATPFISVAIAILIGSVIILLTGGSPVAAFSAMFQGAFGSQRAIGETLLRATPLIFTGLAVGYGFRAGLFNIGAEGQLFIGGLVAAFLGVELAASPWFVAVPTVLLCAMLGGAAWAFIPAVLKATRGAHEVITTMMFTYIARYLVSWLVTGPLKAPGFVPQTSPIGISAQLPQLWQVFPFLQRSRGHMGFVLACVLAVFVWLILRYTTLGFEARAVGFNPLGAQNGGISIASTTVKALCISGALAGLAGASEVMGVYHNLFDQFSSGFGFTGIAVALLAKNNPIAIIPAALLFGAMSAGASTMQLEADVSQKLILILQALIIFLVAAETIVTWGFGKLRARRGAQVA